MHTASPAPPRRVAIACQGGGSHTAFTAGVLMRLLASHDPARHELVGLSGTSGGAVCALLTWDGLRRGGPDLARDGLDGFWADNAATALTDRLANAWTVWASTLTNVVATPPLSPYDSFGAVVGRRRFRRMLDRQVDFAGIDVDAAGALPMLLVGAVDVLTGEFAAFNSRRDRITADLILASAAVPGLFRAVHVDGGTYWDGQFSQNPPVRELLDVQPDEIWVIQVNPRRRSTVPRTVVEIADRRNELAGNLSLHQELHFIEQVNRLIRDDLLRPTSRYTPTTVRVIELTRTRTSRSLGATSKLNRAPAFIRELLDHGLQRADAFLTALHFEEAWSRGDTDAVLAHIDVDARIDCVDAEPPAGANPADAMPTGVRSVIADHLVPRLTVDVTRAQTTSDEITWPVRHRHDAGPLGRGWLTATLRDGRVTRLQLRPA